MHQLPLIRRWNRVHLHLALGFPDSSMKHSWPIWVRAWNTAAVADSLPSLRCPWGGVKVRDANTSTPGDCKEQLLMNQILTGITASLRAQEVHVACLWSQLDCFWPPWCIVTAVFFRGRKNYLFLCSGNGILKIDWVPSCCCSHLPKQQIPWFVPGKAQL